MIDIHTHILPFLDDGSSDIETTEIFLEHIAKANMDAVVFTPHFKRGFFDNSKEKILPVYTQIENIIREKGYFYKTYCAAEVYLVGELAIADIQNNSFMINGSRYILVENNLYGFSKDFFENIYMLVKLGYKPILAHPERYPEIQKNVELAADFMHRDVYLQLNTSSILEGYTSKIKETAFELLRRGYAHFLGSDCHCQNNEYDFLQAFEIIKKRFGEDTAKILAKENPEKMLNNEDIQYFYLHTKPKPRNSSFLRRLFGLK